jgi:hypothetical protein
MLGYTLVNVIFKNSPSQLGFTFKGYKAAEDCVAALTCGIGWANIEDDFGCKAAVDLSAIGGVVLNEMDKEIIRQVDMRIEQELVYTRRVREEQSKPANQIMMPTGKPIVANA